MMDEMKSVRFDVDGHQADTARGAQRLKAAEFQVGSFSADSFVPRATPDATPEEAALASRTLRCR